MEADLGQDMHSFKVDVLEKQVSPPLKGGVKSWCARVRLPHLSMSVDLKKPFKIKFPDGSGGDVTVIEEGETELILMGFFK